MVNEKLNQMHKVLQMMFDFFEEKHHDVDEDGRPQELSDFYWEMQKLNEMMEHFVITSEMVRELRNTKGEGMQSCKSALIKARGDMTKATEILR